MKKSLFILFLIGILGLGIASTSHCKSVVFFIGGWGMSHEQMETFSSSVPESGKVKYFLPGVLSELVRPWHCADLIYEFIKNNNLAEKDLIFVSYSHGGTVAQWLFREHPELHLKKLILVGSPIGGYKFVPPNNFYSNRFPKELPIYVIAGNKSQDVWFLRDENDGVVDLDSALDIPKQNLKGTAIFYAEHAELLKMPEVRTQMSLWLGIGKEPKQNNVDDNKSRLNDVAVNRRSYETSSKYPN